ncbi:MAG: lipopolysaccharide biosynthesis protein, partial [Microbacterium sp.]
PDSGRPLAELEVSPSPGVPLDVDADQAAGATLPTTTPAQRRPVAAALRSLRAAVEIVCGVPADGARAERIDPAALEAVCALDDAPTLFESVLSAPPDDAMTQALLAWILGRPALRDIALVQWGSDAAGGHRALEAQRRWESGEPYPLDVGKVMWGDGPQPDADRLRAALELCRAVAAVAPRRDRPGALVACAWISWALGRSTHAEVYARMAHEIDRHHGLADIVRSMVAAGHLPAWAFQR